MKAVMKKIQIKIQKVIKIFMIQPRQKTTEPIKTKIIKHRLNPFFNNCSTLFFSSDVPAAIRY